MSYEDDNAEDNPLTDGGAAEPDAPVEGGGEVKGNADPGKRFREMEVSEEEQQEIAEERERRLDPDNRPDNAEVDNTARTFEDGKFVD